MIKQQEQELYESVFEMIDEYTDYSPGEKHAAMFARLIGGARRQSVLDAGCGSGKGALALAKNGFDVEMCDLTDAGLTEEVRAVGLPFHSACLWEDLAPLGSFDFVYCCDVMEHLPKEFTMLTVARLMAVARRGVFFSISFQNDNFGAWVGRPLHQTVEGFSWWRDRLRSMGVLEEARDLLDSGVFLLRAEHVES